jgi:hypothetical protein
MKNLYKITYDVEIGLGRTPEQADMFTKRIIADMLRDETIPEVFVSDAPTDKNAEEAENRIRLVDKYMSKYDMPREEAEEVVDIWISAVREVEAEFGV